MSLETNQYTNEPELNYENCIDGRKNRHMHTDE